MLPPTSGGHAAAVRYSKERSDTQPANWHNLPRQVYDSLANMFSAKLRIDLCPGDGTCAMDTVAAGESYVAICQTDCQKAYIEKMMMKQVMEEMENPKNPILHSAAYTKWKQGQKTTDTDSAKAEEQAKAAEERAKKRVKTEEAATKADEPDKSGGANLSPGLAKMLAAAKASA